MGGDDEIARVMGGDCQRHARLKSKGRELATHRCRDITSYIRAGSATSGARDQHFQQSGDRLAQLLIPSADQLDDCAQTHTAHEKARKAAKDQCRKARAAAGGTAR